MTPPTPAPDGVPQKLLPITEHKTAYVVTINSDGTEGRGWDYPLAVCEKEATALRLAKGRDTQGSDGRVNAAPIYRIGGWWYGPVRIEEPSQQDNTRQKVLDAKAEIRAKAIAAGLTEVEIATLSKP